MDEVDELNLDVENEENSKPNKPRINIKTAYDAMQPQPPIKWIVENLISEASVNVFYGEPGIGKTWTLLSMAVHVAEGTNWLGFEIKEPGNVLIVDEESGERRLLYRLRVTLLGEKGNENTPIYINSLSSFQLNVKAEFSYLQEMIEKTNAKLLVIDSLSASMDGDENSKKDVQPVFNHLRKLANITNCAIIIIHHSNKKGGYRGSSAISGSVDLMVKVDSNKENIIEFSTEKTRDILFTSWVAEMVWDDERFFLINAENGFKETKTQDNLPVGHKYVLEYLESNGDSKRGDILRDVTGCSSETARKAINDLSTQGKIRRINEGKKGVEAIYTLI
jgi:RecA-family ATPase